MNHAVVLMLLAGLILYGCTMIERGGPEDPDPMNPSRNKLLAENVPASLSDCVKLAKTNATNFEIGICASSAALVEDDISLCIFMPNYYHQECYSGAHMGGGGCTVTSINEEFCRKTVLYTQWDAFFRRSDVEILKSIDRLEERNYDFNSMKPNPERNSFGFLILQGAVYQYASDTVIKALLDAGAKPGNIYFAGNATHAPHTYHTLIFSEYIKRCSRADFGIVKKMVEMGCDVNEKTRTESNSETSLLKIVAGCGRSDLAALLIDNGADVNFVGSDGHPAVYVAAYSGHCETARLLVEKGAVANYSQLREMGCDAGAES